MKNKKGKAPELSYSPEASNKDSSVNLPTRIGRYSKHKTRALSILDFVENNPGFQDRRLRKHLARLYDCGNWLLFHDYYTVDQVRLVKASFCKIHLLCPLCAVRKGSKLATTACNVFSHVLEQNPSYKLSMLTLTVKNRHDLKTVFTHIQKSKTAFVDKRRKAISRSSRHKSEFAKIHGAMGSLEITRSKVHGWHPHYHIVVVHSEPIDSEKISQEWLNITQDSFIVDCRPLNQKAALIDNLFEAISYAVKFTKLEKLEIVQAYKVCRGKNLFFKIGCVRGIQLPLDLTDEPLQDLPYEEYFYRYIYNEQSYKQRKFRGFGNE